MPEIDSVFEFSSIFSLVFFILKMYADVLAPFQPQVISLIQIFVL